MRGAGGESQVRLSLQNLKNRAIGTANDVKASLRLLQALAVGGEETNTTPTIPSREGEGVAPVFIGGKRDVEGNVGR